MLNKIIKYLTKTREHNSNSFLKNLNITWCLSNKPFTLFFARYGNNFEIYFWLLFRFAIKFEIKRSEGKNKIYLYGISHEEKVYILYGRKSKYLNRIILGKYKYDYIDQKEYNRNIELLEGKRQINIKINTKTKKYNRYISRVFNRAEHLVHIRSNIEIPGYYGLNSIDISPTKSYSNEKKLGINHFIDLYKNEIIDRRNIISKEWVPPKYRKLVNRNKLIDDIIG